MSRVLSVVFIVGCFVTSQSYFALAQGSPATSQTSSADKASVPAPRQIDIAGWILTGSVRLRYEDWDFFATAAANNSYGYGASLVRVGIGRQFHSQDWQFELAQPSLINLPSKSIAPAPQGQLGLGASYFAANPDHDVGIFLKQSFVRFKAVGGDEPSSLRLGRFEFVEGMETTSKDATIASLKKDRIAERLIGSFGFSHVGRSLDGIQFSRATSTTNLTFVAARPTEGVFQVRGMRELKVDLLYAALNKTIPQFGHGDARVFGLYYRDGRDVLKTDSRALAARTADHGIIGITTVGGNYVNVANAGIGKIDVLLWGVIQTGKWGKLDDRANAIAAEAGYQVENVKFKPWFRGGYFRGSGDNNPSDNTHRTFFQVLPTPRIYARFPFYNLMNSEDIFAQLTLRPHPKWNLRSDVHSLRLTSANDLWYSGGGAFQKETFGYSGRPSGGQKPLATVFDVSSDYRLDAQTTLTFYSATARGKGAIRNAFPQGPNSKFGYVELTRRF